MQAERRPRTPNPAAKAEARKPPFFQRLSCRILLLVLGSGLTPLVLVLLFFSFFAEALLKDLHASLMDLQKREGQRLENYQKLLIRQQIRQKALDVVQDLTSYLQQHPRKTWEELRQDPEFRDIALQPVGVIGETFLVAAQEGTVLLYREAACEQQPLEKLLCLQPHSGPFTLKITGQGPLRQFHLVAGAGQREELQFQGYLATVPVRPPGGPELAVAAWMDREEMELLLSQSRTILKTTFRITDTLVTQRAGQLRHYLFLLLVMLGSGILVAGLSLAGSLSLQIRQLMAAARAYDQGDLSYRILNPADNELGQLARTLNHMAATLAENTVSRMEWENTFNALPDQILVVNQQGLVTRCNQAAVLALGRPYEEIRQQPATRLFPPERDWLPREALEEAITREKRIRTEITTPDHHTFLVTVDPCYDLRGAIQGAVLVAREITALKQMQAELAKVSHFLRQILDAAPLGFLFVSPEGLITQVNPQFCQEFGYTPQSILGRPLAALAAREDEFRRLLEQYGLREEILGYQVELLDGQGRPVPARLSMRTLYDEEQRLVGSVCLISNITEEISLQRQLEQAQKQEIIATLAGGLAHNFNNLLMIILGLTSLMLSKVTAEHPLYEDLREIERQVRTGREITRKLLAFRRVSSSEAKPVNLNRLVEATADMFARTRPEITLHKELSEDLPAVEADFSQVQQVLLNLLINAWQAMPQGGRIILRTRAVQVTDWDDPAWDLRPGLYVCLSVTDTGVGMDESTLANLFSPFFTTKEADQGSGLGLASAARIMKNHRGAIQVVSTPGQGSTFTLFFPASKAKPQEIPLEEKTLVSGQGTILLVEDDPTLRRVGSKMLQRLGYQVLEAASGEEALELYRRRFPDIDLVLLDLVMPGLSGLKTLEALRAVNPQVRVILCSGMGEAPAEPLPAGVSFLPKPIPLEVLSQVVAAALGRSAPTS